MTSNCCTSSDLSPFIPPFQDSDGDKSDDLVVDVSNEVRLRPSRQSCLAAPASPLSRRSSLAVL